MLGHRQIKGGTTTAALKRVYFYCVGLDGITPRDETGGQPQVGIDGGAFAGSGSIGVLVYISNGLHYADLADALVATGNIGKILITRYASATCPEIAGTSVHVVKHLMPIDGVSTVLTEGSINLAQAIALILDAVSSILSGADTTTITVKDPTGAADRIVLTVDEDGNRTAVAYTPPSV